MTSKWCLWGPKVGQKWTKEESKGKYGKTSQKIPQKCSFGTILGHFESKMLSKSSQIEAKWPQNGAFGSQK